MAWPTKISGADGSVITGHHGRGRARPSSASSYASATQIRGRGGRGGDSIRGRGTQWNRGRGRGATKASRTEESDTNKERLCFVCGDPNHLAKDCTRRFQSTHGRIADKAAKYGEGCPSGPPSR
nr:DNA topoisomerase 3-alpha-like [Penaeus vannamei]